MTDMNDNTPAFVYTHNPSFGMYLGLVSTGPSGEASEPNTCLLQVSATDLDSGINGQVLKPLNSISGYLKQHQASLDIAMDCIIIWL